MEADITSQAVGLASNADFSIMKLFLRADIIVKSVIIILIACSIYSWAIIFEKIKLFKKISLSTEEFEQKLDQLIATCQQLKRENASLREREVGLVGERGTLLEQNEMARKKIKDMIDRLRSLSAE